MAQSHSGAKVGTKVSVLVSRAVVHTHAKLVGTKHRLALLIFHSISNIISEEVHETLGPVVRQMAEEYPEDGIAHGMLKFLAEQRGQWQAAVGTGLSASGLLGSIAAILNNELSPVVYTAISGNPHAIPDAATIARMAATGLRDPADAESNMAKNGFDSGWAQSLIEMQKQYPDGASMLDLVRRGILGRDTYIEWSVRGGTPAAVAEQLVKLIEVPVSPADAALAVLRGNMSDSEARKAAADWGVSSGDFDILVGNTGEPLGLEQLLEAYRRGFIDEPRLRRGILQSRTRNEWIDVAEKLRYSPMTVSDAVNAVVQNHLDSSQGAAIAQQNGLEPGAFDILQQTAGEPLARTEMEQLYNRGLATEADVKQALAESRLKNKYADKAFQLHTRLIPTGEIAHAVEYGSLTHARAIEKAMEYGYTQEDAQIVVSSAVNAKLLTQRMRVVTAAETLYENNGITQEEAIQIIGQMGFEPSEANFMIEAAEFRRQEKLIAAAMSAVRSKYINHHISEQDASGYLDAIGIQATQRDQILALWKIEHDANVRVLTPPQVVKAVTKQLISQDEGMARLEALGYNSVDADLLISGA